MPVHDLGFSFSPTATPRLNERGNVANGVAGMSPQQAVKILSLRVPERPSPTAIAPMQLLQSQGAAGMTSDPFRSMIAALVQAFKPQPGGMGFTGATAGSDWRHSPTLPGRVELPADQVMQREGGIGRTAPPPPRVDPRANEGMQTELSTAPDEITRRSGSLGGREYAPLQVTQSQELDPLTQQRAGSFGHGAFEPLF